MSTALWARLCAATAQWLSMEYSDRYVYLTLAVVSKVPVHWHFVEFSCAHFWHAVLPAHSVNVGHVYVLIAL